MNRNLAAALGWSMVLPLLSLGCKTRTTNDSARPASGSDIYDLSTRPDGRRSVVCANGWKEVRAPAELNRPDGVCFKRADLRPGKPCGASGSVKERISDCSEKNLGQAQRERSQRGNPGQFEVHWTLVSSISGLNDQPNECPQNGCFEVWLDNKNNLIWSDLIVEDATWCEAAGVAQEDRVCSDNTRSLCATVEGMSVPAVYDPLKGGLNSLQWRLPAADDWQKAMNISITTALPNMDNAYQYWTNKDTNKDKGDISQFVVSGPYLRSFSPSGQGRAAEPLKHAVRCVASVQETNGNQGE